MKRKHLFIFAILIFLMELLIGPIYREHRFLLSGVLFFSTTILLKKYTKKNTDLLWILAPTLIISTATSIYAAIVSTPFALGLSFISIFSVFVALFIAKQAKYKVMLSIFYILSLVPLTYIGYSNYINFVYDNENPIDKGFPKELVLKDEEGNIFNLSNDKGKIIVLDLWSTSCGVCFEKFPDFEKQKNQYINNPNIKFYSINLALKRDSTINITKYTKDYTFKTLYANVNSWEVLENRSVPKILIIDKNFKIVYKGTMYDRRIDFYQNFNSIIKKLLNE